MKTAGRTIAMALVVLGLTLSLLPTASALTLFEYNTFIDTGPSDSDIWSGQSVAQSFNASQTYSLWTSKLYLLDAKRADAVTVTINPDGGGYPDENVTLGTAVVSAPSTGTWYWVDCNFPSKPLLQRGQTYWIVAKDSQSFSNGYRWDRSNNNTYPGGTAAVKLSGGSWMRFDDDQLFQNFGIAASAVMDLGMAVNATATEPGANLRYTLYYNNTGGSSAQRVWVNDSLPQNVSVLVANPLPYSTSGGIYRWSFSPVAPGAYIITLNVTVATSVTDGTPLVNSAVLDYFNETGVWSSRQASLALVVRAPYFVFSKASNVTIVDPGGGLTYTLRFINVGSRSAARVDVLDLLPPGFTLISNSAEANRIGPTLWSFTNVQPGSREITLQVSVSYYAPGPTATNTAVLRSYNSMGQQLQNLTAWALVPIGGPPAPTAKISLNFARARVAQGEMVDLTLSVRNEGPTMAHWMWLNVSLPEEVDWVSASMAPNSTAGTVLRWRWGDVAPGNYSLSITVRVRQGIAASRLLASAEVSYSDPQGRPAQTLGAFATVDIALGTTLPLQFIIVGILAGFVVILTFVLIRRGALNFILRRRPAFDEIFLLHRSGLLIRHYSRNLRADMDSDVIGGMLVAVQDFVRDSFQGEGLRELRVGRHTLLMAQGTHAILAASISGHKPERLAPQLSVALAELEDTFAERLANWNGMTETLAGVDDIIKKLLAGKYRSKARKGLYLRLPPDEPPSPGPTGQRP